MRRMLKGILMGVIVMGVIIGVIGVVPAYAMIVNPEPTPPVNPIEKFMWLWETLPHTEEAILLYNEIQAGFIKLPQKEKFEFELSDYALSKASWTPITENEYKIAYPDKNGNYVFYHIKGNYVDKTVLNQFYGEVHIIMTKKVYKKVDGKFILVSKKEIDNFIVYPNITVEFSPIRP